MDAQTFAINLIALLIQTGNTGLASFYLRKSFNPLNLASCLAMYLYLACFIPLLIPPSDPSPSSMAGNNTSPPMMITNTLTSMTSCSLQMGHDLLFSLSSIILLFTMLKTCQRINNSYPPYSSPPTSLNFKKFDLPLQALSLLLWISLSLLDTIIFPLLFESDGTEALLLWMTYLLVIDNFIIFLVASLLWRREGDGRDVYGSQHNMILNASLKVEEDQPTPVSTTPPQDQDPFQFSSRKGLIHVLIYLFLLCLISWIALICGGVAFIFYGDQPSLYSSLVSALPVFLATGGIFFVNYISSFSITTPSCP